MADAVAILVAVSIVALAAAVGAVAVGRLRRRTGRAVQVIAVRHGQSYPLGSVRVDDPEFSYKIEELRSEARYKLAALNSGDQRGWRLEEQ